LICRCHVAASATPRGLETRSAKPTVYQAFAGAGAREIECATGVTIAGSLRTCRQQRIKLKGN
jgi:hypothetical protein